MRKPRIHARQVFTGEQFDGVLKIRAGCWRRTLDADGNVLADLRDSRAGLWVNIGDKLLVSSADLNEDCVAVVEIIAMPQMRFKAISGSLGSRLIHVMRMNGLRSAA